MLDIKLFIEYGILGIIAFVFFKWANKLFESQNKKYEVLLSNLLSQKKEPNTEIRNSLKQIITATQKEHRNIIDRVESLSQKIDNEITDKKQLLEIINSYDKKNYERRIEELSLLNAFKTLLVDMKTLICSSNNKKIGEILLSKGYITKEQLSEAIIEQADEMMEIK